MKVREPVERPLDVVAVELLLSASQAYVAGSLMYLAVGLWADRGVGLGPVAFILAGLSIAVGAAWVFWLLGGTGWPLAAVSVPVALFSGVALVLGTTSDGLIRLEPLPLMLLLAASIYGIVGGVFLDSPRRWRWDQRQRLRAGATVPRVSPTTRALAERLPRSMPSRSTETEPGWPEPPGDDDLDLAKPAEARADDAVAGVVASDDALEGLPVDVDEEPESPSPRSTSSGPAEEVAPAQDIDELLAELSVNGGQPSEPTVAPKARPSSRLDDDDDSDAIELPTSLEPTPQRSPWAWAAPPDWTREEDDTVDASDAKDDR